MTFGSDWEWEFIDGSYVKAHQHNAGAAGKETQAVGKSRAGNTTKIYMAAELEVTGREINNCSVYLINGIGWKMLLSS